jgi:tRNA nucleotidyltransferase (CCA-adding enzyme)
MFKELNDLVYTVGGVERDRCLGIEPKDIDYVVERTTQEQFESVFPNSKTIGNDFPVYMIDGNQVALARIERKRNGDNAYTAFDVTSGVDILKDLERRDFTMNSIARHYITGEVLDPHNGIEDIENRLIRCINPVAFIEDPLRIYRGARFFARFHNNFHFTIDIMTWELMKANVSGLKNITPDRIYTELQKVYAECDKPSIFFYTLKNLNCLQYHFKPLYVMDKIKAGSYEYHGHNTAFDHTMEAIDRCKANGYSFDVFLAVLFHDTGKAITPKVPEGERQKHIMHEKWSYVINKKFIEQHRFTAHQNELILLFARQHMIFHILQDFKNYVRLIRWFLKIKRHWQELMYAANCDHELNLEQLSILVQLNYTIKNTEINVPKHLKSEGVIHYVETAYAKYYGRLIDKCQ